MLISTLIAALLVLPLEVPRHGHDTQAARTFSVYVPAEDGTRLAVDVHLPPGFTEGERVPALFELTRYWRASENPRTGERIPLNSRLDRALLEGGYALIKVDVRGTGASFGARHSEYGRQEVRDGLAIVEWVVEQPWCDGALGAYGTSYTGTTAELITAVRHPAIKAVIPGWSDFDLYESPARPYGLYAESLIDTWGQLVGWLDDNAVDRFGTQVCRVDADEDGAMRAAAVLEHAANVDVGAAARRFEFRDQVWNPGGDSLAHCSSSYWKEDIEASGVPMLVFASWYDAGTAGGALTRLRDYSNPQKLVILASNHGGASSASPFERAAPQPSGREQIEMRLDFLDHHLRGAKNGVDEWPTVQYFNLGEEALLDSDTWPPAGTVRRPFALADGGRLSVTEVPVNDGTPAAGDVYSVDSGVSTGKTNRWSTQLGGPVGGLDRRGPMDDRMLTYTTEPLAKDLQVTGTPTVRLFVTSNRTDGAFLVYLEDVDETGRSRYITEGGLRALHRKRADDGSRSFAESDALPLVPGETAELVFDLWPTSVLFRAGHRIRVAIAGADADSFARVPSDGEHEFTVWRDAARPSMLELPVVE